MEQRLRKFAKTAEVGSFTQAALDLHISQPALSAAIQKLEKELAADLFKSRKPPLELTKAGEAAYRYAKFLDVRNSNFKLEISEITRSRPSLSIGMIDSIAHALFVNEGYLSNLKQQAEVMLSVHNSRTISQAAQNGDLDIAIATRTPQLLLKSMRYRELGNEPLIAVASPDNAVYSKASLQQGMLANLLGYDKGSNTDRLIFEYFIERDIEVHTIFRSTSPEFLLQLAVSGEGVAVLPYLMVREYLEGGELSVIAGPVPRPIVALEQKDRATAMPLLSLCSSVQKLLEILNYETSQKFSIE